jgi:hypothetical protein
MTMRIRYATVALVAGALALAPVAASQPAAKGGPGVDSTGRASVLTPNGQTRIFARPGRGSTLVRRVEARTGRVVRTLTLAGRFGIPYVSYTQAGGLTPDGRTLVLVEPYGYPPGQKESELAVLDARWLTVRTLIHLDGAFSFDAISPDARTIYLVQHLSPRDPTRYAVRAYDVRAKRLVKEPVIDKSEPGELMVGYPQRRATDADGTWVYTLYTRDQKPPFIHALNTRARRAVCIDLPLAPGQQAAAGVELVMSSDRATLRVVRGATTLVSVDTRTHETDPPAPEHA